MKKGIVALLIIFTLLLSSCDEATTTDSKNPDDSNPVEYDIGDDVIIYEKDGDVVKYFETFGTLDLCGDGSDWNDEDCYEIETVFDDGMTILMRYYAIEGSVYKTFDFIAEHNGGSIEIQLDYDLRLDISVKYYDSNSLLNGWLQFNGEDQSPLFELNQSYEYTVSGDNTEQEMQSILNVMIGNLTDYFVENVGGSFISQDTE